MINKPIKIIDGVCCSFSTKDKLLVLGPSVSGFKTLSLYDEGKIIPYLCRNTLHGGSVEWEVGIGEIINIEGKVCVNRLKVLSSSNNNHSVFFSELKDPTFFVVANEYSFDTAFNNLVIKNKNFLVDTTRTTYFVDTSENEVTARLPSAKDHPSLVVEFKLSSPVNNLYIATSENELIDNQTLISLNANKKYTKLISTGYDWTELVNDIIVPPMLASLPEPSITAQGFSILSVPGSGLPNGPINSFQFNSNGLFDGSNVYMSPGLIYFGGSDGTSSYAQISTTGNQPNVFNNRYSASDFIVKGSSVHKNLIFTHDGKLGINMPSGILPNTALHINNNGCLDGIRLENNNNCHPASITLYHKPSTVPPTGTIAALINLSGKNSHNYQTNYVQLKSRILNNTLGNTAGEFVLSVDHSGSMKDVLVANKDFTSIHYGNNSIRVSSSGTFISGPVDISTFNIDGGVIVFGGLSSDNSPTTTFTPTPTATETPTPTPSATPFNTPTLTDTVTPTPTETVTPTPTETVTPTPTPTETPTPTPTATPV
jgi:hypothetical protein